MRFQQFPAFRLIFAATLDRSETSGNDAVHGGNKSVRNNRLELRCSIVSNVQIAALTALACPTAFPVFFPFFFLFFLYESNLLTQRRAFLPSHANIAVAGCGRANEDR